MGKRSASAIRLLLAGVAVNLLVSAVHAAERPCGILWGEGREIDESPRFERLGSGGAFIDMRTCLVWMDRPMAAEWTLDQAMSFCTTSGDGGMGWQLPTVAELTTLDVNKWIRGGFAQYQLGSVAGGKLWTRSPWPGKPDSLVVVEFNGR